VIDFSEEGKHHDLTGPRSREQSRDGGLGTEASAAFFRVGQTAWLTAMASVAQASQ
jgi:hypothetical protein